MRRDPSDPARLFDQAQNVFYLANAAMDRGDLREGERGMRQYKDLALKMVALDPDNMKWRMEEQYAEADLGTVLFNQRRFPEAASQFAQALHTIEALTTADPGNGDYQKSLVEAVAWLADANAAQGNYAGAMAQRERHVALLNRLLAGSHGDVVYRQKLVPAERALANLYAASGRADLADQHFLASIDHAVRLTSVEPGNTRWLEYGYRSRVDYARHLIATNRVPEATLQSNMACATVDQLRRKDSTNPQWQGGQRDCWMLRAELALATHADDDAQAAAGKALNLARAIKSSDPVSDAYSVGNAYRLVGDVLRARGDQQGARAAWSAGLGALPSGAAERPSEMKLHAELLDRLGRDSRALAQRLTAMGYKGSLT
jgi:tetratricopeptide (TPR) repeat protein